ncbi:MAG: hypothetical protein ACP5J4_01655 [Anaerolineae bacterium]
MPGKNLRQAAATLVQQLQARVQSLIADVTSLEVCTYGVDALQLESVAASEDVAALAAAGASGVKRQGYTRITFQCDLSTCTEIGREDAVDAAARSMHSASVEVALAGRATLLAEGRQTLSKLRR